MRRLHRTLIACSASLVLLACAAPDRVESTVETFGGLASLPARPTYRFERLPSQLQAPGQQQLELLADQALFNAGLRRDDAAPTFGVQVSARSQPVPTGGSGFSFGLGIGGGGGGSSVGLGVGMPIGGGGYTRGSNEVAVVLRDVASDRVVYESRARTASALDDRVLTGLFAAALQGFPQAPAGPRSVTVPLVTAAPAASGSALPATVAPATR